MRGLLQKFVQFLLFQRNQAENDNQGIPLLVSFLLAVTLWFLVTLNQTYQTILVFPIQITQLPSGLQITNVEQTSEIEMRVEGIGLDLLLTQIKWNNRDTLSIRFQEEFRKGYFIPQSYFNQINRNLSSNLLIQQIVTDSVFCSFDQLMTKKVALINKVQPSLDPGVELFSKPILDPDSITIVGPESLVDSIESWPTNSFTTPRISIPQNIDVSIPDSVENIQISPKNVKLFINPKYYTQTQVKAHLQIVNIPKNTEVRLTTDSIQINLLVTMEKYDNLYENTIDIIINFAELNPEIPFIIPEFQNSLPEFAKLLNYSPLTVPYVIVKK